MKTQKLVLTAILMLISFATLSAQPHNCRTRTTTIAGRASRRFAPARFRSTSGASAGTELHFVSGIPVLQLL